MTNFAVTDIVQVYMARTTAGPNFYEQNLSSFISLTATFLQAFSNFSFV